MTLLHRLSQTLFLFALLFAAAVPASAFGWPNNNDNIFPPLPAAKPYINFDGRGFIVHGKRTFIVAGELQYPRTPRALWRDRLLRIKRAGYNTVQTYVFWNYHEPVEGKFDFSGEKDLNAYLQLVHSLGLYAIVRMGPYVDAEWDTGGLPVWLRFKPGLLPMTDNAPFYQAVTPYFNQLVPILAANQINHGGPILMIQMENEHIFPGGIGGGTDMPNSYYKWFYTKMRAMGLQVPLFFSGLNHSQYPAGDAPFDTSQRTSPWYSTEFWTGWTGHYGYDADRAKQLQQATWQVMAYGGAGYTHYTMVGGTDFDTWNNNEQASSYDFDAPIGQSGDIRPSYYLCKRAAMFANSFSPLLADSIAADGGDGVTATGGTVQVTRRQGRAGKALFLLNRAFSPVQTQIKISGISYPTAGPITMAPYEMISILHGYPLAPGVNLSLAAARLLGVTHSGAITTLVVYGNPGEPVELHFAAANVDVVSTLPEWTVTAAGAILKTTIPDAAPHLSLFQAAHQTVRVLTMRTEMADRTWFLSGGKLIACGPDYVGDVQASANGGIRLVTEQYQKGTPAAPSLPTLLYLPNSSPPLVLKPDALSPALTASKVPPSLGPWKADTSLPMTLPGYGDGHWKSSPSPLPMGADGDYSAYAWYRTSVTVPTAGTYQISLGNAADWVTCFVNGRHASSYRTPEPRRLAVDLHSGSNALAFLTAHYGRDKLFNYYGPLDSIDAKGISGPVTVSTEVGAYQKINSFRWQADDQAPGDFAKQAAPDLSTAGAGWADADMTTDVFKGRVGWVWFRTTLPNTTSPNRLLYFQSIDDRGIVYLNGKLVKDNVPINSDTFVPLDSAWREGGPNVLAVAVENTGGPGGLTGEVRLESGGVGGIALVNWKMRGGVSYPAYSSPAWKPAAAATGIPTFYHTTFAATAPGESGPHPVLRVSTYSLSRGFVWLNGRNLGRYPERSPVDGIYLPEPLLRAGKNDLVIFDEDGNSPSGVKIIIEEVASRTGSVLSVSHR